MYMHAHGDDYLKVTDNTVYLSRRALPSSEGTCLEGPHPNVIVEGLKHVVHVRIIPPSNCYEISYGSFLCSTWQEAGEPCF